MGGEIKLVGIDFSGSQNPGRSIWISRGTASAADDIEIESIDSARDLLDARGREPIFNELKDWIARLDGGYVGIDFPFALPASCWDGDEWEEFLSAFHEEFDEQSIDDFPGAFAASDQHKRDIDYQYAGQSPLGYHIKKQVFYGLRDLLYPLVNEGNATVSPMQEPIEGVPQIVEVYPAAAFGRLCCYRTGYKGTGEDERRRRRVNLDQLEVEFDFDVDEIETVVGSDDALDSLCAACVTARAAHIDGVEMDPEVEGHIFT